MIRDSQRGFEFSQLNSLLSRSFSGQDKKIKIKGIINGSVTFTWYESYQNMLNTESCYVTCVHFFVMVLSIFTIEPTNFQEILLSNFRKTSNLH